MIILDTNVVSEPTKPHPNPTVRAWLNRQDPETLYLTTTGLSELLLGVELLPRGRRQQGLALQLRDLVDQYFGPRILSFDKRAAIAYASLVSRVRVTGYAISVPDAQIASIAQVHGSAVATRDTNPFAAAGLSLINPWEEGASRP